jgi:hypothetical protein
MALFVSRLSTQVAAEDVQEQLNLEELLCTTHKTKFNL